MLAIRTPNRECHHPIGQGDSIGFVPRGGTSWKNPRFVVGERIGDHLQQRRNAQAITDSRRRKCLGFRNGWSHDGGSHVQSMYLAMEMYTIVLGWVMHVCPSDRSSDNMFFLFCFLQNTAVKDVMTPIERTFMLSIDDKLSFETIAKIFKTGYSRIPIYEVSVVSRRYGTCYYSIGIDGCACLLACLLARDNHKKVTHSHFFCNLYFCQNNIVGQLFVKDLIFIDPEDDISIRSFVQIFGRGVHVVWPDDTLGDVLAELKKGRSHLALVRDVNNEDGSQDPFYEVKGIITLEGKNRCFRAAPFFFFIIIIYGLIWFSYSLDIIEKILGDTIVDETDVHVDRLQTMKVERAESFAWARLRLLDTKIVDGTLSASEVQAVTAHLRMNHAGIVELLTDTQLNRLVSNTPVTQLDTAKHELGKPLPNDLLYEKGVASDTFTLILSGRVTVLVGDENFRTDLSPWSVLGRKAFENPTFDPDFSAFVSDGPCRCLCFKHDKFVEAVDASAIERRVSEVQGAAPTEEIRHSSSFDAVSASSSADPPNNRQKLIARLFKKESSIESSEAPEITNPRETAVRFEEGAGVLSSRGQQKSLTPSQVGKTPLNDDNKDVSEISPSSSVLNGSHQDQEQTEPKQLSAESSNDELEA